MDEKTKDQHGNRIAKMMLDAAYREYCKKPENQSESIAGLDKLVIMAVVAAEKTRDAETKKLGGHVFIPCSPIEVAASAFWAWDEDVDICNVSPSCVGGARILCVARAVMSVVSIAESLRAINTDIDDYCFCVAVDDAVDAISYIASECHQHTK